MAVLTDAPADPTRRSPQPLRGIVSQTAVLVRRLLLRAARTPMTFVHGLLLPLSFLITLKVVFGDSITSMTGQNSLYRSVPLVTLISAMSGSSTAMVDINAERFDGFLARLWALPLHRASGLFARLFTETIRLLLTTLTILAVGMALGFRFRQGVGAALLWVSIPMIFGLAFAALAIAVALYWPGAIMVEATQPVIVLGATFCTGFVPLDMYPDWVAPAVRHQPMSLAVDAMRGLAAGGPVSSPLTEFLLICGAVVLACLAPIVVGYRKASTT